MKTNGVGSVSHNRLVNLGGLRSVIAYLVAILALSLSLTSGLRAQQATSSATIEGTVTDPSGAGLPGATITVTDVGTGITRTAASDQSGVYTVPLLPPGTYSISATATGFQTKVVSGIVLQVAQRAGIDISLPIGAVTDKVEVSGSSPLLETQSAAVGSVVESERIENIPLNGRQFLQLALLSPDVVPSAAGTTFGGGSQGPQLNINGGRQDLNYFVVDGVDATNSYSNSLAISPSVDAIQEFKVETSLGSIYTGGTGTSTVNVVMKSGTNAFHGDVYDYLRNNALDAENYFSAPGAATPPYKQNQFGGVFGGPILHSRTFFFGSYEGLRLRQTETELFSVPTLQMRQGNFSECASQPTLCTVPINPSTGQPFPNNTIPGTAFNSASKVLQQLYPLPTSTNPALLVGNFTSNSAAPASSNDFTIRIDHHFNEKNSLFGHFLYLQRNDVIPGESTAGVSFGTATGAVPGIGHTAITTERNFALGYTRIMSPNLILQANIGWNRPGAYSTIYEPGYAGTNWANITGITGIAGGPAFGPPSIGISGFNGFGGGAVGGSVAVDDTANLDFTYTHRNHTFVFGTTLGYHIQNAEHILPQGGSFSFLGIYTGNAYADFLLGVPFVASSFQGPLATFHFSSHQYGFYFGDTWRVTPRLVLTYGLRNDYEQPWGEKNGRQATMSLNPLEIIVPGTGNNFPGAAYFNQALLPQVEGIMPIVSNQTAGYPNRLINSDFHNLEPRFGFSWTPFAAQKTVLRGGFGIYTGFKPYWGLSNNQTFQPFTDLAVSVNLGNLPIQTALTGGNLILLAVPNVKNFPDAYAENYDLSVQQSITKNLMVDVTYTGSATRHLEDAYYPNIPTTLGNEATLPYPRLAPGTVVIDGGANANYNAGTITVQQRLSHGVVFSASFTESKALDTDSIATGVANTALAQSNNKAGEYGPATFDVAHRFVASYVWQLPFGTGREYLSHGWAGRLLDWDWSGITTIQSGQPFTVGEAGNECGNFISGQCRPNQVLKDPRGPRTVNEWFNTAAFAIQPTFADGTAGRDSVRAPGVTNFDMSLAKIIPIQERISLRFQFDAFNIFNTPPLGIPQRIIDSPSFGQIFSAGNPRLLQVSLKLLF